ncbi:MAG TPA: FtsQ-type POTRA domain-containing protein [Rhizomicrobium sp.]|nr:FtsQ-type POTRA domain-containing protein [Rhizomicrobium sp.]
MRSLKSQRKTRRNPRAKATLRATNGARIPAERLTFGKRKKRRDDIVSRFIRGAREKLTLSRPMLALTVAFLALTAVAALFAGGYVGRAIAGTSNAVMAVVDDAGFGIKDVGITGNLRTPEKTIMAALNIEDGKTSLGYDIHAARARLLLLPWIAQANVRRRYPDTIAVDVVEKQPFALWDSQDGLYVIEHSGKPIALTDGAEFKSLPRFVGDAPQDGAALIAAIATHRAVHARVFAMQRMSGRRWNLILDDKVIVELPEDGWQKQLDVLEHLLVDTGVLERDITEIDLRARDNYFFILRNGQPQTMQRGNAT